MILESKPDINGYHYFYVIVHSVTKFKRKDFKRSKGPGFQEGLGHFHNMIVYIRFPRFDCSSKRLKTPINFISTSYK